MRAKRTMKNRLMTIALCAAIAGCATVTAGEGANSSVAEQPPQAAEQAAANAGFTQQQAGEGEKLYAAVCASCHSKDLSGGKGPALKGVSFEPKWKGQPARKLYARIRTTMPPEDPGSLSEQAAIDIVAYLLGASATGSDTQPISAAAGLDKLMIAFP